MAGFYYARLIVTSVLGALALSACTAYTGGIREEPYRQAGLPDQINVAYGHEVVWETIGRGQITYVCRERTNVPEGAAWILVALQALLTDKTDYRRSVASGAPVASAPSINYAGPPPTFTTADGSMLHARLLDVDPSGEDNLPMQLFRVEPPLNTGALASILYVQRLATQGGGVPQTPCATANVGATQIVPYQADYLFWRARFSP